MQCEDIARTLVQGRPGRPTMKAPPEQPTCEDSRRIPQGLGECSSVSASSPSSGRIIRSTLERRKLARETNEPGGRLRSRRLPMAR